MSPAGAVASSAMAVKVGLPLLSRIGASFVLLTVTRKFDVAVRPAPSVTITSTSFGTPTSPAPGVPDKTPVVGSIDSQPGRGAPPTRFAA